jgi:membrane-associated protease RseP (regulator of RpoE activity)
MDDSQPSPASEKLDRIETLRREIADLFLVYDTTLDHPEEGLFRFRGRFLCAPGDCYPELRQRYEAHGFTPIVETEDEDRISIIALPVVFETPKTRPVFNLILFIITIFTTLFAGAMYGAESMDQALQLWRGWPFAASILLILGAHELGHYFAARHHHVPVTLPYFIPMPFSPFGTLGAFIRLQGPVNNRRVLFDVGAAGPLAGLVFAVPILIFGLATSDLITVQSGMTFEGNSFLYLAAKYVAHGRLLPGGGVDVLLNQVAWAGWVGLFVTGLNLLPVGQLDGGHVAYALFGRKARLLFWPVIGALATIVLLSWLNGAPALTWVLWIGLLMFVGRFHARPLEDLSELDPRRRILAICTLALFFLTFVPAPLVAIIR